VLRSSWVQRFVIALVFLGLAPQARADTPVASGAELSAVEITGTVDYSYELFRSAIRRERHDPAAGPLAPIGVGSDLEFELFRHTITPRLEIGVWREWFIQAALPIVITQARELRLASGVDRTSSSTVMDGLLPPEGFDARDPGTPLPGDLMFRGINRKGLDQVHLGLGATPMNQDVDPSKPTWRIGAEVRLAVGDIMKFDRLAPGANTAMSRGVQELVLWTHFTRKLSWAQPWVELFWQVPLTARSGSLFENPGFGATNTLPGQQAGVGFGLQLFALDQPADKTRISLDLGTRAVAHFEGREYTEMWEVFAYAGDSRSGGPLVLDADPTRAGVQPLSYPGVSNIENYLETTGRLALRAQIGPHVRFAVIGDLVWRTDHAITFADAGVDRPDDGDELINPGTEEVNPLHVQRIDLVGHRYRSEDNFSVVIGVQGQILF
jgi:hypothetical protein